MGCFTPSFLVSWLIWLIVLGAIVAIVRLLLPKLLAPLGPPAATAMQIIDIILWVVVAVAVLWLVYDILVCAIAGLSYRPPPVYR